MGYLKNVIFKIPVNFSFFFENALKSALYLKFLKIFLLLLLITD